MQYIKWIDELEATHSLPVERYAALIENRSAEAAAHAARRAEAVRQRIYGKDVYIRGLIEVSAYCKNNCFYCGIRAGNASCERYRLTDAQIRECCETGYALGFRTFVLQGGEDAAFTDERLCGLIKAIKRTHPDCAVTLSLGERSRESYRRLYEAGADRYLLRHETANAAHYARLHPASMSFENRMQCLSSLREIGFQVGCGFMVGSPYQTAENLAEDLKFIESFRPDMCGIGPFIPHHATPFADRKAGTLEDTLFLLSLIRLIVPNVLLPATTALGTIAPDGRERGIRCGANVIMPNLSPEEMRRRYELYDNKLTSGAEAAENLRELKTRMTNIGYTIVAQRGDVIKNH